MDYKKPYEEAQKSAVYWATQYSEVRRLLEQAVELLGRDATKGGRTDRFIKRVKKTLRF